MIDGMDRDIERGSFSGGTVCGGKLIGGRTMVSMLRDERERMMDSEALESESSTGMIKVI
jgi:hypothetical protein